MRRAAPSCAGSSLTARGSIRTLALPPKRSIKRRSILGVGLAGDHRPARFGEALQRGSMMGANVEEDAAPFQRRDEAGDDVGLIDARPLIA